MRTSVIYMSKVASRNFYKPGRTSITNLSYQLCLSRLHCKLLKLLLPLCPTSPLVKKVLTLPDVPGDNVSSGIALKQSVQEVLFITVHSYETMGQNVKQRKNMMMLCLQPDRFGFDRPCSTIHHGREHSIFTGSKRNHGPLCLSHRLMTMLNTFFSLKILLLVLMDSLMRYGACYRIILRLSCKTILIA